MGSGGADTSSSRATHGTRAIDRCAVRPAGHDAILQACRAAQLPDEQHPAEDQQQRDEQSDERGPTRSGSAPTSGPPIRPARQEVQLRPAAERGQSAHDETAAGPWRLGSHDG